MWFSDACTPHMAGTCNSVRCLLTSALSRAEVKGDFGGSLMRQSSKVRVHALIMEIYEKAEVQRDMRYVRKVPTSDIVRLV
jgi:hypothetical protein